MRKENARLVEGERKHLIRKVFKQEKRGKRERTRRRKYKKEMLLLWKTFCHKKIISNKGHMS